MKHSLALGILALTILAASEPVELFDLPGEARVQGNWRVIEEGVPLYFTPWKEQAPEGWPGKYLSTSQSGDGHWVDKRTGTLRSPSFLVTRRFYKVLISGGCKYNTEYLSFKEDKTGKEICRLTGLTSTSFDVRHLDLAAAMGKRLFMDVVDHNSGSWGQIRFGGLKVADQDAARALMVREQLNLLKHHLSCIGASIWLRLNVRSEDMAVINDFFSTGSLVQKNRIIWLLRYKGLGNQDTVTSIRKHLKSRNGAFVSYNLMLLSELNDVDVPISDIVNLMQKGSSVRIRREAIYALGKIDHPEAYSALVHWKEHENHLKGSIQWIFDTQRFTRTQLPKNTPGTVQRGWLDGMAFWLYLPKKWKPDKKWPVFARIHGTWGSGRSNPGRLIDDAEKYGFVIIAPTFDTANWWDFGKFGLVCGSGRSDIQFWRMIDGLAPYYSLDNTKITLYGHSEGGQFVNRIALVYPGRVRRAASSGTIHLVRLDHVLEFPFGLRKNPLAPDIVPSPDELLKGRYMAVMGDKEVPYKLESIKKKQKEYQDYIREHDIEGEFNLIINPGVGHSGSGNYGAVREWLMQDFH